MNMENTNFNRKRSSKGSRFPSLCPSAFLLLVISCYKLVNKVMASFYIGNKRKHENTASLTVTQHKLCEFFWPKRFTEGMGKLLPSPLKGVAAFLLLNVFSYLSAAQPRIQTKLCHTWALWATKQGNLYQGTQCPWLVRAVSLTFVDETRSHLTLSCEFGQEKSKQHLHKCKIVNT